MDDETSAARVGGERPGTCPHVDRNDPRCATRFSLGRIEQAFCVCFGIYHACPMYHRISRELAFRRAANATSVTVTISGGLPHAPMPLRPTGT